MSDISKINYFDLRWEHEHGRLPKAISRPNELQRITRILGSTTAHHCIIVGGSGTGKTSLIYEVAKFLAEHTTFHNYNLVKLDTSSLQGINGKTTQASTFYLEAFRKLLGTIACFDDFGELVHNQPTALQYFIVLLKPLLEDQNTRLVLTMSPVELEWIEKNHTSFIRPFEVIQLKPTDTMLSRTIIENNIAMRSESISIEPGALDRLIHMFERFPSLGNLPGGAIHLLDECIAETIIHNIPETIEHPILKYLIKPKTKKPHITQDLITKIVAEKTNIPLAKLSSNEKDDLKTLPTRLNARVIGQHENIEKMSLVIQRARLGLRSTNRPLGSFLILGPSGVGKTETAKALAEEFYGKSESFLRIDMSEFGEPHTVQRLIGSPPGYVGFESGGQLTNHFKKEPYSLLLLDEIEKAHPKIFDVFLQMLDDGRITSGQGDTVDVTQSIIIATSNLGVDAIIEGYLKQEPIHSPEFMRQHITPLLLKHFRMEFLNRFDAILIFNPLSVIDLTNIALLEIAKIEQRVKEHNIKFNIAPEILQKHITQLADPRFGARPVKRFVEDICESLITKTLLK